MNYAVFPERGYALVIIDGCVDMTFPFHLMPPAVLLEAYDDIPGPLMAAWVYGAYF